MNTGCHKYCLTLLERVKPKIVLFDNEPHRTGIGNDRALQGIADRLALTVVDSRSGPEHNFDSI